MEGKKKGLSLTTQILIATAGGIVFGSLIGPWASNLKFIGDIFIRLIQIVRAQHFWQKFSTFLAKYFGKTGA